MYKQENAKRVKYQYTDISINYIYKRNGRLEFILGEK